METFKIVLIFIIIVLVGVGIYLAITNTTPTTTPTPTPTPTPTATTPTPTATATVPAPYNSVSSTPAKIGSDCNQVPVYRLFNGGINAHMDSLDKNEASNQGYVLDGQISTVCSNNANGTSPVYRGFTSNGHHMSSTNLNELSGNGFTVDSNGGPYYYAYLTSNAVAKTPIYRRYASNINDHLTTSNPNEGAGYTTDGVLYYSLS